MAKSDDWSTPPDLMKVLDQEFRFTLEVCASAENRALPHTPYLGLDNGQDALTEPWGGAATVSYCNPPYSMLPLFVGRAAGQSGTRVLLIPAYTDTKYFQETIAPMADEVRFLAGRLRFWDHGKPGKDTARFPSAVVIFRPVVGVRGCLFRTWNWRVAL